MKSAGLVQIFHPIDKERTEKMCQDGDAEFISDSLGITFCLVYHTRQ